MNDRVVIGGETNLVHKIDGQLSLTTQIDGDAGAYMPIYPASYTGATEVTPSEETQTLLTHGLTVVQDIVVNPIPTNYGRITYMAGIITVE